MQVQVAHVGANLTRRAETNLGIHVGAVHVHLAAVGVHNLAHLLDLGLEHAKGARVRNHHGADLARVLCALGLKVRQVQVARLGVALDGQHAHARHSGRRGVRAVGGDGDDAEVALEVAPALVVLADGTQTGEFTLGARVRLQGHAIHGGDILELVLQSIDDALVSLDVFGGSSGVDIGEAGKRDESHLGAGIQLHSAGPERDHGVHEGQVLGLEVVNVPEELGLGMVRVEDGVRQVGRLSPERLGDVAGRVGRLGLRQELLEQRGIIDERIR